MKCIKCGEDTYGNFCRKCERERNKKMMEADTEAELEQEQEQERIIN